MPQITKDLQSQNWRELDTTLDSFTICLKPFVKKELRNKFGLNWEDKVFRMPGQVPNLGDPSVILKTMLTQWWDVFHNSLGHKGKNLVGELIEWRNVSAHRGELSQEDVIRALDSMARFLDLIAPLQQTDEIVKTTQELLNRKIELQRLHFLPPGKLKTALAVRPATTQRQRPFVNNTENEEAKITDPVILVKINRSYKSGMASEELYEVARGDWAIAADKRSVKPQYAIAVVGITIVEVYEIHVWHTVDKSEWYKGETGNGRQCFDGIVATDKANLIGKTVSSYINARAQNPVKYVNC